MQISIYLHRFFCAKKLAQFIFLLSGKNEKKFTFLLKNQTKKFDT